MKERCIREGISMINQNRNNTSNFSGDFFHGSCQKFIDIDLEVEELKTNRIFGHC